MFKFWAHFEQPQLPEWTARELMSRSRAAIAARPLKKESKVRRLSPRGPCSRLARTVWHVLPTLKERQAGRQS